MSQIQHTSKLKANETELECPYCGKAFIADIELDLEPVRAQRDALLAAAKKVVAWYEDSGTSDPADATVPWKICRQAIADCEQK